MEDLPPLTPIDSAPLCMSYASQQVDSVQGKKTLNIYFSDFNLYCANARKENTLSKNEDINGYSN